MNTATQLGHTHPVDRRIRMTEAEARAYLARFALDPALLGAPISAGRQHSVFRYGERQVVKLPNTSLYMALYGAFTYAEVQRDVDILERYMPEYLAPTQVLPPHDGADDYVIVQDYLPGARFVSGADFERIRDDFAAMVSANRRMIDEHRLSLDFFGNQSFRQSMIAAVTGRKELALLNNVLLVEQDGRSKPVITDVNLSELRLWLRADVSLPRWMIDGIIFHLTRWMIVRLFGIQA